ncbi:MAG: TldD/PmbA family protein [Bacilli bacterium]|nr:TldD/PmbA family protein [Bacilli bacterium]
MKYDKFFALAKEAGIEEAELYIGESYSLSFSLFHSEVDNYSSNKSMTILARGIVNGKFGTASCDSWSAAHAKFLVDSIVANAKVIENEDPAFIFEGSKKYKKINTYNKELEKVSIDEKMKKLFELEKAIKEGDKRVVEVGGVEYSEDAESVTILNSKGLKLTQKSNYFVYVGQAVAKEGKQTKSGYELFLDNDFSKFDVKKLAKEVVDNTVSQLGGEACESNTYKAVLSPDVVKSFLGFYIGNADAEDVQKKSSLFINKINQKVASRKITVEDKPLKRNVFSRWFDDEGVATYNKAIIKNGVLMTYLYNLTTASKDGVESTGNASRGGSKMGTSTFYLELKPGKKSQEELFKDVQDGVYITEVQGLHAGLNPQSGNFSLQSSGFLIKNGKKDRALDVVTVSGNLIDVFKDVLEVGNDQRVFPSGIACSSLLIKKIIVSGK